ncbi:MAG: hypothetical protein WDO56_00210 [Gammaproteobacteria bacterium]
MLDELRPLLSAKKVNDFLGRLSDEKRPEQLIGGEMELGLLWAIRQTATLQVDPAIPGSTRVPEAFSRDFFDHPAYIEVTTISDGKLSGEAVMQRAAQKIVEHANNCRKKGGKNLFFSFAEKQFRVERQFYREHHVSSDFELDDAMKAQIRAWVNSVDFASTQLHLSGESINVVIACKDYPQRAGFNYFCSLPPLAYHIEDNPLYTTLESKADQLADVPPAALKVIFVADGGSSLLRRLTQRDHLGQYKSGEEIITHFLGEHGEIDMVGVFSPDRKISGYYSDEPVRWNVSFFEGLRRCIRSFENLERLRQALPRPRFAGYQARSLQKQRAFRPERGWYLGTSFRPGEEKITVKMSARLLQEYLAGKIAREQFEGNVFPEQNLFKLWLEKGYVISGSRLENAGTDEDDDQLVFEFTRDPAAAPFS